MTTVRFTLRAEADILSIHDYTVASFGVVQWVKYESVLKQAFENIRSNPQIGSDFSAVKPGVRRMISRNHVIYYRVAEEFILVLRILSLQQDPGRHL